MGAPAPAAGEDPQRAVPDAAARLQSGGLRQLSRQSGAGLRGGGRPARHRRVPRLRLPELGAGHGGGHGGGAPPEQAAGGHHVLHRRYSGRDEGQVHPEILCQPRQGAGKAGRSYAGHQGYVRPAEALRRQEAGDHPEAGGGAAHPPAHPRYHRQSGGGAAAGCRGGRGRGGRGLRADGGAHQPAVSGRGGGRPPRHGARHRS